MNSIACSLPRDDAVSYLCETCPGDLTFHDAASFKEHLKTVHGLASTEGISGTKQMILHLDSATHFVSQYRWEIPGVKFVQSRRIERDLAYQNRCRRAVAKGEA